MTTARASYSSTASSVPQVREFARRFLEDVDADAAERVVLMLSELATNAIKYSGGDTYEVNIDRRDADVRVEVRDGGGGRPVVRDPEPTDASGRGLLIVDAMAQRWGIVEHAGGKTVWFTVPTARQSQPSAPRP